VQNILQSPSPKYIAICVCVCVCVYVCVCVCTNVFYLHCLFIWHWLRVRYDWKTSSLYLDNKHVRGRRRLWEALSELLPAACLWECTLINLSHYYWYMWIWVFFFWRGDEVTDHFSHISCINFGADQYFKNLFWKVSFFLIKKSWN
jgi:hypothetical protein